MSDDTLPFPSEQAPRFDELLASLDPFKRHEIESKCTLVSARAGDIILRQNDLPDAIYIIDRGVVEVHHESPDGRQRRCLAYMSRGDIFGEIGILTKQARIATITACEDVELRRIPRADFLNLLKRVPQFGSYLCTHLAGRLARATLEAAYQSYCTDFGGNLRNFDMLLIFQTIASSGEVGELRLRTPSNDLVGSFLFRGNRVEYARFGHLLGIEAVWQVFLEEKMEGAFAFEADTSPSVDVDERCKIDLDGTDMLMQAASKRDYYQALPAAWKELDGWLGRQTDELEWPDDPDHPEFGRIAQDIWNLIARRPQHLDSIWRRLNICRYHLAEVAKRLVEAGQATVTEAQPAMV